MAQKEPGESAAAETPKDQADAPRGKRSPRKRSVQAKQHEFLVEDEELTQPASTQSPPARRTYKRRQNSNSSYNSQGDEQGHPQGSAEQGSTASSTAVVEDDEEAEAKRGYDAALRKALGLQAKRVYTTAEMATKLRQREIPEAIIDKVLARLTALGALDDAAYARLYVSSKWRQTKRGPSLIRQDMLRRGLEVSIVEAALQAFFGDEQHSLHVSCSSSSSQSPRMRRSQGEDLAEDDEVEQEGVQGSGTRHEDVDDYDNGGAGEMALGDQLLEVVKKRHEFMRHLPAETQRRRLTGFLQRRGHSWGTARQVLQHLGLMK